MMLRNCLNQALQVSHLLAPEIGKGTYRVSFIVAADGNCWEKNMRYSEDDYPIFKVEEMVTSRGPEYKQIIPQINSRYFNSNPRFKSLGQVSSPRFIDYMGIYEEGDRWTLIIIKATINNAIQYLFLPLTETIHPDPRCPVYGKPAFGIETNLPDYGKREWQVFDAFADVNFMQKLCNLFFPWVGVSENHVNAYIDIQESGIGRFEFYTKYAFVKPLAFYDGEVEPIESCFVLKLGGHNLRIYQTLPVIEDTKSLQDAQDVMGWISYSGEQGLKLLIGVLYRVADEPL